MLKSLMERFRKTSPVLSGVLQTERAPGSVWRAHPEEWGNLTHKLTPGRLRAVLAAADAGDIFEQHRLFADMEDRCEHLAAEMAKRKRALLTLDWEILPGRLDDPRALDIARRVREQFDAVPGFEDLLLDLADAVGHGFSALEIRWGRDNGAHVPEEFLFRPQTWFQLDPENRNLLRLRDGSQYGQPLVPFGWVVHVHRGKSGWLPRAGLFRSLSWTYLIRAYALEANINYVQVHGLPFRLGKYPPGSSEKDRTALFNALRSLGRDAAGIIPQGMDILFQTPAAASRDVAGELIARCELGMSKAILGGTLTSQADGHSSTNALGRIHNEVRHDLLVTDALQVAATITQQILAPMAALNCGIDDRRLLPWFRFDTREPADICALAEALPKLAPFMRISSRWAHEKLKIPMAENDADALGASAPPNPETPPGPPAR